MFDNLAGSVRTFLSQKLRLSVPYLRKTNVTFLLLPIALI